MTTMEKRHESFIFYASFYEALQGCPDDIRLDVYEAVIRYAVYGDEPTFDGVRRSLFVLIKPQIDANIRRRANGSMGGRKPNPNQTQTKSEPKPNRTRTEPEPNTNQDATKSEPNVNDNVNVNDNDNENGNDTLTRVTEHPEFFAWLETECPYIARHYKLPTDNELKRLTDEYGGGMVAEMCQQLENRADLRKRYTNLYRTLINWLKREKANGTKQFNTDASERLNTYAAVAAGFRRDAEVRRSADVHGDI